MKWKKGAQLLTTVLMVTGILAGCSGGSGNGQAEEKPGGESSGKSSVSATGFPIVQQPITLNFFAGQAASAPPDWNKVEIWKEYAAKTNVNVNWQLTPVDSLTEKRNLLLAGGDLPDAFHTARFTSVDLANYGAQGLLIPLNDLIDQYAPNFKALMEKHPEIKKGLTMPDGNIYSLPTFYDPDFKSVVIGSELWINKKFLSALGMKEPTTTEEFYQYLKAVKTGDPNGNGKNDEIPYAASGVGGLLDQLKGSWGLGNRGNTHPRVDMDPDTGKLRFIPADPKYKELLQYVNRLYKENLFIPEILTIKGNEVLAKGKDGLYGSFMYTNADTFGDHKDDYTGANALTGPGGERLFSRARSPLVDAGAFAITSSNKYPEATMRWADYFYSEEGSTMFFMGIKDKSYVVKPDGSVDYTDEYKADPEFGKKYVTWAGGYYPAMLTAKTFKGGESSPANLEAAKKIEPYYPEEVWPPFTYTQDEVARFTSLETDISAYVEEMTTKFVTGDAPFSEWDNYVATLKKMGLDEYMDIYNQAYERYKKE
ncbi:ABC transporter substrate-binding protein [Paenibacillus sp. SSG-1]|uniref:Sugar ABC transporter substrate-binding protein n=1 Tax=Paenibacillus cineris TaxID=237530 RepID=A0ABQ4LP85_9BACL|nr:MULTISPECIES: extracellular solute-binding protein [Paenibacillus]OXL87247.1 ABC transporter substrate-binding protein [Paenibacillus sp. SSG-1]GIO58130.1 sugar ABC transporter substrate-binding protein [Paenibacillus cineris]